MDMATRGMDLADPDVYVERVPFEWFSWLRRNQPVFWQAEPLPLRGFWAVTRYHDVAAVLSDPATFSSAWGVTLEEMQPDELEARRSMLETDPPGHSRLRRIVGPWFSPRSIRGYEQFCRALADDILDKAFLQGEFDFVEDVARQLPIRVLARILGVPDMDASKLIAWGDRMIGNMDSEYSDAVVGLDDTTAYRLLPFRSPAAAELTEYGYALARHRRKTPRDDLISRLVHAEVNGQRLTRSEFDNFFSLLVVAGNETTRHTITHAMLALLRHRDQWRRLVEAPALLPGAVEEMLRLASVTMQFRRTATRDVDLGGQRIREGDKVVTWFISANHDEAVFRDPHRLDVTRDPNPHLVFGGRGPHFCLGASLARMEIRVLFERLLPGVISMEQIGPAPRLRSNFINGIKHLPVRVQAA